MSNSPVYVRRAESPADSDALLNLIERLAEFESLAPPDSDARARFAHDGFERKPPRFEAVLAGIGDDPACGYAIFFETYSTFLCRPTFYLEDIFVVPENRKSGVGKAIMKWLVREAIDRGCGRVEWQCLDWNTNAQAFYNRVGAEHMSEWMFYRLSRDAMMRYCESAAAIGE